jgi:hypothetical protein
MKKQEIKDIIDLIKRYCVKNNIFFDGDDNMFSPIRISYLSKYSQKHGYLMILIDTNNYLQNIVCWKNDEFNIWTKGSGYRYVTVNDMVKLERASKVKELLN